MISNIFLVGFVAFLSWSCHWDYIQTTDNITGDICTGHEDLSHIEMDLNHTEHDASSSISAKSRKRMNENTSPAKKIRKQLKYHSYIKPINIGIDDEMENFLKEIEREMVNHTAPYKHVWQDYRTLKKGTIRRLCINAWMSLKSSLKAKFDLNIKYNAEPDCDGAMSVGPSEASQKNRPMIGLFQYAPELKGVPFHADLLRCNCAYRKQNENTAKWHSIGFTKQFFYLQKVSDKKYRIMTLAGDLGCHKVKIVSVYTVP